MTKTFGEETVGTSGGGGLNGPYVRGLPVGTNCDTRGRPSMFGVMLIIPEKVFGINLSPFVVQSMPSTVVVKRKTVVLLGDVTKKEVFFVCTNTTSAVSSTALTGPQFCKLSDTLVAGSSILHNRYMIYR